MAKFITIKRKNMMIGGLFFVLAFLSVLGIKLLDLSDIRPVTNTTEPQIKIVSIDFNPAMEIKDVTYAGERFKGLKTITATNYKISAVIQNMTEITMTNIPIRLTVLSLAEKNQQLTKEGVVPTLEPGMTAKVGFENIKALGDAKGISPTAGQHELKLSISTNSEGGVTQATEAKVLFNIDSKAK